MTEVEKQVEEVMNEVQLACFSRLESGKAAAINTVESRRWEKKASGHIGFAEGKLRTLLSTSQTRITNLEAMLKFADARINSMVGQAEGAQSGEQVPNIVAGARALCEHAAIIQNVNADDYWAIHGEEFKEEARIVIAASQPNGEG